MGNENQNARAKLDEPHRALTELDRLLSWFPNTLVLYPSKKETIKTIMIYVIVSFVCGAIAYFLRYHFRYSLSESSGDERKLFIFMWLTSILSFVTLLAGIFVAIYPNYNILALERRILSRHAPFYHKIYTWSEIKDVTAFVEANFNFKITGLQYGLSKYLLIDLITQWRALALSAEEDYAQPSTLDGASSAARLAPGPLGRPRFSVATRSVIALIFVGITLVPWVAPTPETLLAQGRSKTVADASAPSSAHATVDRMISLCLNEHNDLDKSLSGCDVVISALQKNVDAEPQSSDLKNDLRITLQSRALLYAKKKDFNRVIDDTTQLIKLNADDFSAYMLRATANSAVGSPENVISDATMALHLQKETPASGILLMLRAGAYADQHNFDLAITDANASISLKSEPSEAARKYAALSWIYLESGNLPRARGAAEKAADLDFKDSAVRENRGHVLLALGETSEAIVDFSAAIAADPTSANVGAYWGRGQCYEKLGKNDLAKTDYQKAADNAAFGTDEREMQARAKERLVALGAK